MVSFYNTMRARDQFVSVFGLTRDDNTSKVLMDNDIRRFHDNCHTLQVIREYFDNSKSDVPNLEMIDIWSVHNVDHYARFKTKGFDRVENMLLWHGTRRHNLVGILQNGFLPTDHGEPYGPAVHFADRVSNSARYTDGSGAEALLLCQVAVGKRFQVWNSFGFENTVGTIDSIESIGRRVPDKSGHKMFSQCLVPCGQTIDNPDPDVKNLTQLEYNKYMVFDQDRVRIRGVLHCQRDVLTRELIEPPRSFAVPLIPLFYPILYPRYYSNDKN